MVFQNSERGRILIHRKNLMKIEQIQNDAERDFINSLIYLNPTMLGRTLDKYQISCYPGICEVIVELIEKNQNENHELPLKK